jgi:kynureninase
MIGLDLSHSAGAVMHKLHEWGTDFAFWCNYKYFNGGPGAAASLFVHERHLKDGPALSGWFGYRKDKQFALALDFEPSETASAWEIGTPHVMSMATLFGSLNQFGEVGMKALREKSVKLTESLIELIETRLAQYGFSVGTPRESKRRGGHVALVHPEAARINEAMKTAGIIPDYREPNIIRLAPVPLYTRFVDMIDLVNRIEKIMQTEAYKKYENKRGTVA